MYGFLAVDFNKSIEVKTLQMLASRASRYSKINVYMKPFVMVLYAEYAGKGDHVSFTMSPRARRVISLFRVLLGLTAVNRAKFSRTMSSYGSEVADITIEFDASLFGIGLLYYAKQNDREVLIGGGAIDITILNFGSDASYQNTAEFIAAVLGIRGLAKLNLKPRRVNLRGDSISVLTWAETGKFKGDLVGNASVIFILQGIYNDVTVDRVIHLLGEDNWRADYLSRGGTLKDLVAQDCSLGSPQIVDLNGDEIMRLCCGLGTGAGWSEEPYGGIVMLKR
jgi:hypothetical protein